MSMEKSQDNPVFSEKRVSQWEELMRKFSEAHKEECNPKSLSNVQSPNGLQYGDSNNTDFKDFLGQIAMKDFEALIHAYHDIRTLIRSVSLDMPRESRSVKQFPTGSRYEGTWDVLGMSGYGTYTFPSGVLYEGEFEDGMFHGAGEMRYPSGAILRGKWKRGQMTERTLIFADGLEYNEHDWKYCRMPDRRFTVEYETGLQPAGRSYLTADQPTRVIPAGYYDTGDGFYDPKTKVVYKANDLTAIIRSPSVREQKWIKENCRTAPEMTLGPRPDLYEEWSEPQVEPKWPPPPSAQSRPPTSTHRTSTYDQEHESNREHEFFDSYQKILRDPSSTRWNQKHMIRYNPFGFYNS